MTPQKLAAWYAAAHARNQAWAAGLCACWCPRDTHERWNDTTYCGRCGRGLCPRFRLARDRWYQFWRPRLRVPDSPAALAARTEEIR